ncbi:HlyD family secretion protein [Neptuniibacter sp.]|uniref:efflux RND transporter periplasmic adaptor subunit n=1 Tax=Neptuniibacter sp. TaxID=1962643 RepID=UPI002603FFDB|nr:HlyD family secretion protein [Neptuniibacter sp.]MCP4596117.1 HlyD family efflux transporter periplasmic adaptor subunit [Neptuniibacter sp.]
MTAANIPSPEAQLLNALLHLSRRCRSAKDRQELAFIAVNETHTLSPYRQAALWFPKTGIQHISGVASPEANAPYMQWLNKLCKRLHKEGCEPLMVNASKLTGKAAQQWQEWAPANGLFIPLVIDANKESHGGLFLSREQPWHEYEIQLLKEWLSVWARSDYLMAQNSRWWKPSPYQSKGAISQGLRLVFHPRNIILGLAAAAMFYPVKQNVLAPAELIPLNPTIIRAPLDGVIAELNIQPNDQVNTDTQILEYDRTSIENRMQLAKDSLAVIKADYRQKAQQALYDQRHKTELALLKGKMAEKETEISYLNDLHARGIVKAEHDGIVLFNDRSEWEGRPVVTGEKIMVLANEREVEVEAWLAPSDLIPLQDNAQVTLYLSSEPLKSINAELQYIAHEAELRPDGNYAYRVRAKLTDSDNSPRIGLKGTAKLEGEKVTLGYWIFRRPIASTRAWLGW